MHVRIGECSHSKYWNFLVDSREQIKRRGFSPNLPPPFIITRSFENIFMDRNFKICWSKMLQGFYEDCQMRYFTALFSKIRIFNSEFLMGLFLSFKFYLFWVFQKTLPHSVSWRATLKFFEVINFEFWLIYIIVNIRQNSKILLTLIYFTFLFPLFVVGFYR